MSIKFDAVVFDMDGVIFDTERILTDCWAEVALEKGITDMHDTILKCIGITQTASKAIMREAYGEDFDYESMHKAAYDRFRRDYGGNRIPVKKGVRELLARLKAEGKRVALATSTARAIAEQELTDAGLICYFDQVVCGDMVKRSKPAPDIFLTACQLLGVDPVQSVGIEDSYNGIRAVNAAGMHPIMVPDMLPATDEMRKLAEVVVNDLTEAERYMLD